MTATRSEPKVRRRCMLRDAMQATGRLVTFAARIRGHDHVRSSTLAAFVTDDLRALPTLTCMPTLTRRCIAHAPVLLVAACVVNPVGSVPPAPSDPDDGVSVEVLADDTIEGAWRDGNRSVAFTAAQTRDGPASARYSASDLALTVVLDADTAEITVDDVTIDGFGELTEVERAALERVGASMLDALRIVPLEVGCEDASDGRRLAQAALLFPWQLLIKYGLAPAGAPVEAASCRYAMDKDEVGGTAEIHGIELDAENDVPYVLGVFPFDATGATDDSDPVSLSGASGPCEAACRGACGPDCVTCTESKTEYCDVERGEMVSEDVVTCPTYEACQDPRRLLRPVQLGLRMRHLAQHHMPPIVRRRLPRRAFVPRVPRLHPRPRRSRPDTNVVHVRRPGRPAGRVLRAADMPVARRQVRERIRMLRRRRAARVCPGGRPRGPPLLRARPAGLRVRPRLLRSDAVRLGSLSVPGPRRPVPDAERMLRRRLVRRRSVQRRGALRVRCVRVGPMHGWTVRRPHDLQRRLVRRVGPVVRPRVLCRPRLRSRELSHGPRRPRKDAL